MSKKKTFFIVFLVAIPIILVVLIGSSIILLSQDIAVGLTKPILGVLTMIIVYLQCAQQPLDPDRCCNPSIENWCIPQGPEDCMC